MADDMSDEELSTKLSQLIGTTPIPEEKINVHTFLHNVATSEDTTKLGYLIVDKDINELGVPRFPMRTLLELELYCREVANMDYYADYFKKKAEILTASSLSRDAKLITLAVMQKREIADTTKVRKKNSSWFKKKETPEGGE
jgi:hypothetical protein